jgi:hypothetical protein
MHGVDADPKLARNALLAATAEQVLQDDPLPSGK